MKRKATATDPHELFVKRRRGEPVTGDRHIPNRAGDAIGTVREGVQMASTALPSNRWGVTAAWTRQLLGATGMSSRWNVRRNRKALAAPITPVTIKPCKILDAPFDMGHLQEDFYMHLVHGIGSSHVVVGLASCVHLYELRTARIIDSWSPPQREDLKMVVKAVRCSEDGRRMAVCTHTDTVTALSFADVATSSMVGTQTYTLGESEYDSGVTALDWRPHTTSDQVVMAEQTASASLFDSRCSDKVLVFGESAGTMSVAWSPTGRLLAGGNNSDNTLRFWDIRQASRMPFACVSDSKAGIKALAWHPVHESYIAAGAGTADRCVRLYRVQSDVSLRATLRTPAQVEGVYWGSGSDLPTSLVTTFGFQLRSDVDASLGESVWTQWPLDAEPWHASHQWFDAAKTRGYEKRGAPSNSNCATTIGSHMTADGRSLFTLVRGEVLYWYSLAPPPANNNTGD
jgi:hypothetical protein